MITFRRWLSEYAGQVVNTNFNNDEFLQTRVNSKSYERVATIEKSPDKANCNYLKVGCKKDKKTVNK